MITRNVGAFKNKLALKVLAFKEDFVERLMIRRGLRLGELVLFIFLIIIWLIFLLGLILVVLVPDTWLSGWNYNEKLSYVPFADTKPEEKFQISPSALFRFLHDEKTTEQLDATEAEMLDVLKDIDKASKITEVEIHQSSMGSATSASKLFHVFNVFRTTSEADEGDYWWSLEKNLKYIVLQRSRNKDDVKDNLYGKPRKQVKPVVESIVGKGPIQDLFAILLTVIRQRYNIVESNCQSLVSFISKQVTEIGYEYKGWYLPPNRLHNPDVKLWQTIHLANDIPVPEFSTSFLLAYFERTNLVDLVIKSDKYDINALHGGFTPLHVAIWLGEYQMAIDLLKDPINADPTTRDSRFGMNALHLAVLSWGSFELLDLLLAHDQVKIDDVNGIGRTALHFAARTSNAMAVRKLIEKGANPNVRDKAGLTPLHLAARKDTKKILLPPDPVGILVAILEAQKAKQSHVDEDKSHNGWTALHHSADSSNEIAAELLIDGGADVNFRDNDGLTPLHVAALKARDLRIIDWIFWKMKDDDMYQYRKDEKLFCCAYSNKNLLGAEIAARLERINNLKEKPQSWADKIRKISRYVIKDFDNVIWEYARRGELVGAGFFPELGRLRIERAKNSQEIDEILKEEKFDINSHDLNWDTPLLAAIGANSVNAVRWLLEIGADPTKRNYDGLTPFQVAATRNKDLEILDLLLEYEDVDINDGGQSGYTLLHWAMATSNVTAARFLLSKGANPNVADRNGATPLHVAACCASTTDVIKLILETKKVDINVRDKNGQTALLYAVRGNRVDNVDYLLENGADPAIHDENGDTPVHLAAAAVNKDSAILDLLLVTEKKIDIDERNNAGMTALHMAFRESNFNAARFLLSKGANPNVADENGLTPLHLAANFVIVELPQVTMSTPWTARDQICYITHSNISMCKVKECLIL
jgi:ankyrin repeat protein